MTPSLNSKLYSVVNVFGTIQGEGALAGTPAVFIRMAGCNMWSGVKHRREEDAARNGAECPKWCDTDFRMRMRLYAEDILAAVRAIGDRPLIVITGGEPMLQLDDNLIGHLLAGTRARIAIETNGTVKPDFGPRPRVWTTLSPKLPRARTVLTEADELKLVWPAHAPAEWETFPVRVGRFIQPQGFPDGSRDFTTELAATSWVEAHPEWRLSMQLHKVLGVP